MKRHLTPFLLLWSAIFVHGDAWGEIYYYSGSMDAAFTVEESMQISIPAGVTKFFFNYPLPQTYDYGVNSQSAGAIQSSFSPITPSSTTKTDEFGNQFNELVWDSPPSGAINGIITYAVSTGADWDNFVTSDLFPLSSYRIPAQVSPFLEATDEVQSDHPSITSLASSLTSGLDQEWQAVFAICEWVMENIAYGPNQNTDAVSTYNDRVGVCGNFSHLTCALLRAAGIPARYATGYSLSKPYFLDLPGGAFTGTDWNEGHHAWLEVYYPSLGWVPYDAQRDLHHIDTHRILFSVGQDNNSLVPGTWGWYYSGIPPATYPTVSEDLVISWTSDNIDLTYVNQTPDP